MTLQDFLKTGVIQFTWDQSVPTAKKIYKSNTIDLTDNSNEIRVIFNVQEGISEGKKHCRIKLLQKRHANGTYFNMSYTDIIKYLPYFNDVIMKVDNKYIEEVNRKNLLPDSKGPLAGLAKLLTGFTVELSADICIVPKKIPEHILKKIISTTEDDEILVTSLSKELKVFIEKWDAGIKNDVIEGEFQKILVKHKSVLPLIFPLFGEFINSEEKITKTSEDKENKIDLLGDTKTGFLSIIELKRPTTKIFQEKGKRNNMLGVSGELATSILQLNLYKKRSSIKKEDLSESFRYGILIIGQNSMLTDETEINTWNLLKENTNNQIFTFDDVGNRARLLISALEK